MQNGLFRKASLAKIQSPEKLDTYLKVVNPRLTIVIVAVALLLAALAIWGCFGTLDTTLAARAYRADGAIVCYVGADAAQDLMPGMVVLADGQEGEILTVSDTPLSRAQAEAQIGDGFTADSLALADWNARVELSLPSLPETARPFAVTIITRRERPLDFVLYTGESAG